MFFTNSIVRLGGLILGLSVAAACGDSCCCDDSCKPAEGEPEQPSIAFAGLPDVVHCADDVDPNTPGVQIDLQVDLINDDGSGYGSVDVSDARGTDGNTGSGTFTDGEATVRITLVGGEAPGAENTLTAVASNGDSTQDLTDTATIRDDCVEGQEFSVECHITSPGDGDTATETPFDVGVACSTTSTDPTIIAFLNTAQVRVDATSDTTNVTTSGTAQLANAVGTATVPLTKGEDATLGGQLLDPTNALGLAPDIVTIDPTILIHVNLPNQVDVVSPRTAPPYTDADDLNSNPFDGISIALDATADEASAVSFDALCQDDANPTAGNQEITGTSGGANPEITLTPTNGRVHITAQIDGLVQPDCTLTLTVDGEDTVVLFTVQSSAPTFSITLDPTGSGNDGAYLAADDPDLSTADVLEIAATFTPSGDVTGLTGTVRLTDPAGNLALEETAVDLSAPFLESLNIDFSDRATWHLEVFAVSATDVDGPHITRDIVIDTVDPDVVFFSPNAGLSLNASNDADPSTAGFQARIVLVVSAGTTSCTVTVDGVEQTGAVAGTSCTATVTLDDGTHTLSATAADAAGNVHTSGPITFNTDSSIPTVESIVVDNAGSDNVLNAADNGGAATGNVASDVTVTFSSDMDGRTVRLTGPGGTKTAVVSGGAATFTTFPLTQGDDELVVTGSDPGGNALDPNTTHLTVTVDTVPPVVVVEAPPAGTLNLADDADGDASNGLQTDVIVTSDAGDGQSVQIAIDGTPSGAPGTLNNGSVTVRVTVPDGNRAITATVSDPAGNPATSDPVAVSVDTAPPVLVLVANDAGSADDLDGNATNGVQVNVTVTPTGLAAGLPITITSDLQGGAINTAGFPCVSAGDGVAVQCRVTYLAEGDHHVTAAATDAAGNVGVSNTVTVTVATGIFFVAITNPPLRAGFRSVGVAEDTDAGATGAQIVVTGTTDAPVTATAQVLINGATATTCTVDGAGGLSCAAFTLDDGATGTFEVTVQDGPKTGTSGEESFRVDLGRPTTAFTNPAGATATFNKASDLQQGVAGLQVQVNVDVTQCENGVLQVLDGATVIGSTNVDASGSGSLAVAVSDAAQGDAETWTATCTDSEGNTPTTPDSFIATVDITSPGSPTLNVAVLDARAGNVGVTYTQPGDDNFDNAAGPTAVQIFFSKTAITDANFGGAGQIAAANVAQTANGGTGELVDTSTTPLAFDNTWFIALRATDDVGNRSALATTQVVVATNSVTLAPPAGVNGWAQALSRSRGDINGDNLDDIVVGAPNQFAGQAGAFEVILGGATENDLQRTVVTPPASFPCAAGTCTPLEMGWAVNVVKSIDGDAFDDVIVVGYDSNFNQEFLFIYPGSSTGIASDATPAAVLEAPTFGLAGYNAQTLGDVDGDGAPDWGFTAPLLAKAYVFLNTGAVPTSGLIDDVASTVISNSDATGSAGFGAGIAGVGSNGDTRDDIMISCTGSVPSLFVVRGQDTWPATLDLNGTTGNDFVAITKSVSRTPGFDLSSGDVDGDGDIDAVYFSQDGLTVVENTGATWSGETTFGGGNVLLVGTSLVLPSLNGDARADLVQGGKTATSIAFGANPIAAKTADTTYAITVTGSDAVFVSAANLIGSSPEPDLILEPTTRPGSIIVRF